MSSLPPPAGALALQPLLHDLITALSSPTVVLSAADGQIRSQGAQGVFRADIRAIGRAELSVAGGLLEPVSWAMRGADSVEFVVLLRQGDAPTPDPTVWLRRRRSATPVGLDESIEVVNSGVRDLLVEMELVLATDLLDMETVKAGGTGRDAAPQAIQGGVCFGSPDVRVEVTTREAGIRLEAQEAVLTWTVSVPARSTRTVRWTATVSDSAGVVAAADPKAGFRAPLVRADDRRLAQFVAQSVADLRGLRMTTPAAPAHEFLAAGSPWYLTLFGRDSIWAARMLLPLGTDLAAGTLHALAARQGRVEDADTAEEPGKILHEIRRVGSGAATFLPPVYYGTVDATPLWVCLLADAWRWGLPDADVEALLPTMERALEWLVAYGDSDGDGFLEYVDKSARGLANQGWKDSGDSIRFADGRIATGPVALAEVQAYAYEAALAGAELLDAFGRPGAARWRQYAADLQARFRERFWARDEIGDYPILALDGNKEQVDAPASNMGHLLASGMLSPAEAAAVAARLVHPTMSSGFGLRTMSSATGGFSPLSYHCGSVWPHDTAITILGLQRAGFAREAAVLSEGLLAASAAFDGRLPELYGGFSATDVGVPVPYPASCRPQAWSAAAAVVLLQAHLGLRADVPAGEVRITPGTGIGALSVTGLVLAGEPFRVDVAADGRVLSTETGSSVRVRLD
ncbi:Amylo-alpha-1,6-glucosidase [Nakamurella panacisegetis]|uniref:Amylo-alpha-1,6-glucosidase n=1 Tax=Nakamurella panacisegetis TaxID=1090615 RepID=A0A1H0JMY9_9ACTN|nr:glycogen debranching N-terminal domain-containing protein [Nakamurella panacisegetis]SDO44974.1 Amylo-alpha-1,6-glucosidase [Nakamurella panacisegetis]